MLRVLTYGGVYVETVGTRPTSQPGSILGRLGSWVSPRNSEITLSKFPGIKPQIEAAVS